MNLSSFGVVCGQPLLMFAIPDQHLVSPALHSSRNTAAPCCSKVLLVQMYPNPKVCGSSHVHIRSTSGGSALSYFSSIESNALFAARRIIRICPAKCLAVLLVPKFFITSRVCPKTFRRDLFMTLVRTIEGPCKGAEGRYRFT